VLLYGIPLRCIETQNKSTQINSVSINENQHSRTPFCVGVRFLGNITVIEERTETPVVRSDASTNIHLTSRCCSYHFCNRKKPLGRPRCRWEHNISENIREIGWKRVDWIHLARNRCQWWALVNTVMNLQVP